MTGTPPSTLQAAAGDALGALERYELHMRQLVTRWLDTDLYHAVTLDLQEVRRCCHALPPLSAAWVGLLVAHAELVQALWHDTRPDAQPDPDERARLLQQWTNCARHLQQRCMDLAAPPAS